MRRLELRLEVDLDEILFEEKNTSKEVLKSYEWFIRREINIRLPVPVRGDGCPRMLIMRFPDPWTVEVSTHRKECLAVPPSWIERVPGERRGWERYRPRLRSPLLFPIWQSWLFLYAYAIINECGACGMTIDFDSNLIIFDIP